MALTTTTTMMMMMMMMMVILMMAPAARATTWYVSPNGIGTSCKLASPCSVSEASAQLDSLVALMRTGSTGFNYSFRAFAGDYYVDSISTIVNYTLAIEGQPMPLQTSCDRPVFHELELSLDGSHSALLTTNVDFVRSNIRVLRANRVILEDTSFHLTHERAPAVLLVSWGDFRCTRCVFTDLQLDIVMGTSAGGAAVRAQPSLSAVNNQQRVTVEHSEFRNCTSRFIQTPQQFPGFGGGALFVGGTSPVDLVVNASLFAHCGFRQDTLGYRMGGAIMFHLHTLSGMRIFDSVFNGNFALGGTTDSACVGMFFGTGNNNTNVPIRSIDFRGCLFQNNTVTEHGAVFEVSGTSPHPIQIVRCYALNNHALTGAFFRSGFLGKAPQINVIKTVIADNLGSESNGAAISLLPRQGSVLNLDQAYFVSNQELGVFLELTAAAPGVAINMTSPRKTPHAKCSAADPTYQVIWDGTTYNCSSLPQGGLGPAAGLDYPAIPSQLLQLRDNGVPDIVGVACLAALPPSAIISTPTPTTAFPTEQPQTIAPVVNTDVIVTGSVLLAGNVSFVGGAVISVEGQGRVTLSGTASVLLDESTSAALLSSGGTPVVLVLINGSYASQFDSISASYQGQRSCEQLLVEADYTRAEALTALVSLDTSQCGAAQLQLGAIIGIAMGGFVVAAAAIVLLILLVRRKNQQLAADHAKDLAMRVLK